MSDAADRIESVVEGAVQTAADIVQGEEMDAAAAIEAAQDRIEAAEEAAEVMAQAALMTNLGREIQDINERFTQWQTASADALQTLQREMETMRVEIAEMKATPSLLIQQPSQTSTPAADPSLPDQVEPILEAAVVTPLKVVANVDAPPVAPPAKASRWT